MWEYQAWHYLCRELAKINNIINAYEKIIVNIEIKDSRYKEIFLLFLDSFTRCINITLDIFFQERKDVWSLYRFDKIGRSRINNIKKKAKEHIILRNERIAHLSKKYIHQDNFRFLTLKGIQETKTIVQEIENLLREISDLYKFNEDYIFDFIGANNSVDCLMKDIIK